MLQYNKIYQSLKKVTAEWHAGHIQCSYYWTYIIFFEDGTMTEANIASDDFDKIKDAFSKKKSTLTLNKFTWNGKELNAYVSNTILHGGFTFENKLVIQSNVSLLWDLYSPID